MAYGPNGGTRPGTVPAESEAVKTCIEKKKVVEGKKKDGFKGTRTRTTIGPRKNNKE